MKYRSNVIRCSYSRRQGPALDKLYAEVHRRYRCCSTSVLILAWKSIRQLNIGRHLTKMQIKYLTKQRTFAQSNGISAECVMLDTVTIVSLCIANEVFNIMPFSSRQDWILLDEKLAVVLSRQLSLDDIFVKSGLHHGLLFFGPSCSHRRLLSWNHMYINVHWRYWRSGAET